MDAIAQDRRRTGDGGPVDRRDAGSAEKRRGWRKRYFTHPLSAVRGPWSSVFLGLLAALGLLVFYLGVITLAQDWRHALQQLSDDRWFVGAIMIGFGTQIGLFTYLRGLHVHGTTKGVVASTGVSTTAMLACCAHHLTEVLPILGLSSAAIFLNVYKTPLLWLGIAMNLAGIAYMLRKIRQQRKMTCHIV